MGDVQHCHALPEPVAGAMAAEAVETATRYVTERVAAKRVAGEAYHVDEQQGAAQADMKRTVGGVSDDGVVPEHRELQHHDVKGEAVQVVEDEQAGLAVVRTAAGLMDGTRPRVP